MEDPPGLGAYIARGMRARRGWLGIDQAEVARRMGTSTQTISDMELGRRRITADHLPGLCVALECELSELVRGAPEELTRPLGLGG